MRDDLTRLLLLSKRFCPVCGRRITTSQFTCNKCDKIIYVARKKFYNNGKKYPVDN